LKLGVELWDQILGSAHTLRHTPAAVRGEERHEWLELAP
jgi:hypothetical protein